MEVTALAGGVGGSKLLVGLQTALAPGELTAIVNTADDAVVYGVHVSPDVDIVTYWLAGIADRTRGWGIKGDTFNVVTAFERLGSDSWFSLGDADFATCLFRTQRIADGVGLSAITDEIRRAFGVATRILPMSDDPVRTRIVCDDGRTLEFQEYFVRERQEPVVEEVRFAGIADAKPAPGVIEAIRDSDRIVVCPSNPIVSVAPILSLPGVRDALREHPNVIAVSPIVGGRALKGPAEKLLPLAGAEVSATGVAGLYADFCTTFVMDALDQEEAAMVEHLGMQAVAFDTIMSDLERSTRLAENVLQL
ncbi:MAG TPA: 2-phospho-L-lactate transferase [Actinomycetota bacterium]|nr:2-phospho-L-lactate transferase [Actinomycetota bacterium]